MPSQPPSLIALDRDDYHASRVGRTKDGMQVFVTTPFIPALDDEPGREFLTVYLFDPTGKLSEAARTLLKQRMAELGPIDYGRIEVQPFAIERFGTTFGLVPRPPEGEGEDWWVELQPGNYMAFHEP